MNSLAERVRAALMRPKPGYGSVETEESADVANRAAARRYLPGNGPWMRYTATPNPKRERARARRKRTEARRRATGLPEVRR